MNLYAANIGVDGYIKKMKFFLINFLLSVLFFPALVSAQVYNKRIDDAIILGDTALQRKVLVEWKFEWPDDPDLWLAQSLFSQRKAASEPDSAKLEYLTSAKSLLKQVTESHPERLASRFAYISLLGDMSDYSEYTAQILSLLDAHDSLGNDWLWKNGNKLLEVDEFVKKYVDMYVLSLYNRKDESLYFMMDKISNRVLQSYPQHVPALLSLSINALHRRDFDTAITHLRQANSLQPTNTSVLDNLATAHEGVGDLEAAIQAYMQIEEHGDPNEKDYAAQKIDQLSKSF